MAPVGRHSQKPDEFYDIVRSLVAEPRVEIFARQVQPGFYAHGRELD
jgi:N6-adenosine-specific RNA methylase IME4